MPAVDCLCGVSNSKTLYREIQQPKQEHNNHQEHNCQPDPELACITCFKGSDHSYIAFLFIIKIIKVFK